MTTDKTNAQREDAEDMPYDRADRNRCPLCGGPNGCAIEAGKPAESCWCMRATIEKNVLASVPLPLQGRACICPACAAGGK
ncbi:cysteine-rich CWC family protein [Cohnella hashimotonis]|uniref:Cysteine-rich CWC family protein n=1 Tax=Cohnella hashimotonis TaxID=2826895 RepID=A0ABT6TDK8_9BACL|nr:cysteine-rich CWC family protein [Cohnella hashimotonis]MDI4644049.1 cysteine-rich CWC family protein [Cohnella hashimotonis]